MCYGTGVDSASNGNEYRKYFLRGKGGRCVGLTTLASSCADRLEIWGPQPPGTLRACPGLWDCFFLPHFPQQLPYRLPQASAMRRRLTTFLPAVPLYLLTDRMTDWWLSDWLTSHSGVFFLVLCFWVFFWFFWFVVAHCTQLLSQAMYNLMMATTMAETCSC